MFGRRDKQNKWETHGNDKQRTMDQQDDVSLASSGTQCPDFQSQHWLMPMMWMLRQDIWASSAVRVCRSYSCANYSLLSDPKESCQERNLTRSHNHNFQLTKTTLENTDLTHKSSSTALKSAVEEQRKIGVYHMIVGFLVDGWVKALKKHGVKHPQTKMELIMTLIWDHICKHICEAWNSILHSKNNFSSVDDMSNMVDRLHWYQWYQDENLDYRHSFLVDYSTKNVGRWTWATRRAKLGLLNTIRSQQFRINKRN